MSMMNGGFSDLFHSTSQEEKMRSEQESVRGWEMCDFRCGEQRSYCRRLEYVRSSIYISVKRRELVASVGFQPMDYRYGGYEWSVKKSNRYRTGCCFSRTFTMRLISKYLVSVNNKSG